MTADATGFKNYRRAPLGDRVESAEDKLLLVVSFERLGLLVH